MFVFPRNKRSRGSALDSSCCSVVQQSHRGSDAKLSQLTIASMDQKHLHSLLFAITAILSPPTWNTNRWVGEKKRSSCPSSRGCWSRSGKYLKSLSEVEVDEGRYRARKYTVKVNYNASWNAPRHHRLMKSNSAWVSMSGLFPDCIPLALCAYCTQDGSFSNVHIF